MIDLSLKLKQDITQYVEQLNLLQENEEVKVDVFTSYLQHQDVSDERRTKIERLLATIQQAITKEPRKALYDTARHHKTVTLSNA